MKSFSQPLKSPGLVLLSNETDVNRGKPQLISNINACIALGDAIRSTLGPRGLDKLIVDSKGEATITNDGATIMKLLDIIHPTGMILSDIANSSDCEVGDGTTTVVLIACELLDQAKRFLQEGIHPKILIKVFRKCCRLALGRLHASSVSIAHACVQKKYTYLRDVPQLL
jgi:T-complex protein 1 subunit eta